MPPTTVLLMTQQGPSMSHSRSRSKHINSNRSLDDFRTSLLQAGTRKVKLSLKITPILAEGDSAAPTPPSTATPAGFKNQVGFTPGPMVRRRRPEQQSSHIFNTACGPICNPYRKRSPVLSAEPPPSKESTAKRSSSAKSTAGRGDSCDGLWVWGEKPKRMVAESTVAVESECKRTRDGSSGDEIASEAKNVVVDIEGEEGERDRSRTFGSACSTEALTECARSFVEDEPASAAKDSSASATPNSPENEAAGEEKKRRSSKLRVEGKALDAPFLDVLSGMSLRFPEPPTRPPSDSSSGTPTCDKVSTLAVPGWGKTFTSGLPSLHLIRPSGWQKTFIANRRRLKSGALWAARSKASKSITESSFQSIRSSGLYRSKKASKKDATRGKQNTLAIDAPPLPPPPPPTCAAASASTRLPAPSPAYHAFPSWPSSPKASMLTVAENKPGIVQTPSSEAQPVFPPPSPVSIAPGAPSLGSSNVPPRAGQQPHSFEDTKREKMASRPRARAGTEGDQPACAAGSRPAWVWASAPPGHQKKPTRRRTVCVLATESAIATAGGESDEKTDSDGSRDASPPPPPCSRLFFPRKMKAVAPRGRKNDAASEDREVMPPSE